MPLRNLKPDMIDIACQLIQNGWGPDEKEVPLVERGRTTQLIHALFPQTVTSEFQGSLNRTRPGKVHRTSRGDGRR